MFSPVKTFFVVALVVLVGLGAAKQSFGANEQPFIGLQIQGVSASIAKALGLEKAEGVMVRDIAFPGPNSRSELMRGDIIVELDGVATTNVEQVVRQTGTLKQGTEIQAQVLRRGKKVGVKLQVGHIPPRWDIERNNFATIPALGLTFAAMTQKVQKRFNIGWRSRGVVVSLVDEEKAAGLDIAVGDVVVQVNQSPVWKPAHIVSIMQKAQKENKEMVLLMLEGANGFRFALLPVPKS